MNLLDFIRVPLFQRAFLGCLFSGLGLSLLGLVILSLNLTTIRFALMHVALLGAALALVLGFPPLAGALAGIVIASLLLGPASDSIKLDTGNIGAIFMTGSLGLAFMLFYKAGIPAMDAFALFTGNVLALEKADLWAIGILTCLILAVFSLFYREIQMMLYNPELAESLGVPVKWLRNGLLLLAGLAIGLSIRTVGALLIDAAVLLPAMAALAVARGLKSALILAAGFGILSQVGGLAASMILDLPSGASITLAAVCVLGAVGVCRAIMPKIERSR
ncbi:zinc transport system permease protein [Hydrogenispora ethanolica]|uniref:Zinc transport system permease protein n=1 Tax=Hydrogenispora ethanolica TaxID=1082276 RepID=A0A4R1RQB8_HYDET|nr:metal ABC transporter permease [Hydrogenispora ethanolica]TCL68585.1 zinc transport system permease protein [Hydrogenispora ethanolica]